MKKMKKGFTIVELVIVIGVIAILSAILIPTFVNLTDKANKARAAQEVSDAYTVYVMDAADGYVGEDTSKPLASKTQAEVYVLRDGKKYVYGSNGWEVGTPADGTRLGDATYNGCEIYVK